jgi:hypothetical protein
MTTVPPLLGTYTTPKFKYGDAVMCEVRGEVLITGLTDAPIPWPVGKKPGGRARTFVVYEGLAEAVRREAAAAICAAWGVTPQTVTKWRKAMGVEQYTEGTTRLKSASASESEGVAKALEMAHLKDADPERRAKIAAAKRGKKRPPEFVETMRKAKTGTTHTTAARAKMSAAHTKRGTRPPKAGRAWTEEEDEAVRNLTPMQAEEVTGRSISAIYSRRHELGLPDGRRSE